MSTTAHQGVESERPPRSDKGRMQWTKRDREALQWIGEQYAIRMDQLAVLLGRSATEPTRAPGILGNETVRKLVHRWKKAGLVDRAILARGEPGWVWLTREGLDQMELEYRLWEPKAQSLPHLFAINQARLLVEVRQPEAEWRSERMLNSGRPFLRSQTRLEHRPDAEVVLGQQVVAIEVERSVKAALRLRTIFYELARTYAGIWYFCPPAIQKPLEQALAQLDPAVRRKFSLVRLLLE